MSTPRDGLTATRLLNGGILLAGGNNGTADLLTAEVFDPKTSTFSAAANLRAARRDHLAFLLPDNNSVLIVGGTTAGAPIQSSELFIPWQNRVKPVDSLSSGRAKATGTPLKRRGMLMIAGGNTVQGTTLTASVFTFATVTTDKPDYQPGDTVTLTGAGFQPGEVVAISIVEDSDLDNDSPIQFNVTADGSGGFTDSSFHINTPDLNVSFTLTATGQTSGYTAETTFTDSVSVDTHVPNGAACAGGTTTTFTLGATVCAKASGLAGNTFFFVWIDPFGAIRKNTQTASNGNDTDQFVPAAGGAWTVKICANSTCTGTGDQQASTSFTVTGGVPDLTVTKTANVTSPTTYNDPWTWTLAVSNAGTAPATFASGQTILRDNLPSSSGNPSYGAASVGSLSGITGTGSISCSVASNTLSCIASGGTVILAASTGGFSASVTATPSGVGIFTNPAGVCAVDPNNVISESNKANNPCNSNTIQVNRKAITVSITVSNKTYDGTASATILTRSLNGVVATDVGNVTVSGGSAAFSDKNAGTGKTVTANTFTLSGSASNNYVILAAATTTANITTRALTVTAVTNSKIYDATASAAAIPTITVGTIQTGDTANFVETYDTKNVGTGKTLTPSGTVTDGNSGNNYAYTFVTNTTGVITARALTVTAATNSKVYDANTTAAATPTITSGTLQDSETANFTEVYTNKNVGTGKTLIPSGTVTDGNSGNNHTNPYVNNTTGLSTAPGLTITAATNTKPYDGTASAAATPTTSGLQGTDTVTGLSETYDNKNAGSNKTLTVTAGYTVNDGNSGNNYSVTTATNTTGVINKAALTITAASNTKTYDATTTAAATPTTSGVQTGDTVTALSETYDNANAGTGKTLSVATYTVNDGNSGGNYTVSLVTNTTGVINPATPGVSESGPTISTYGISVTLSVTVTPPSGGAPTGTVAFSFVQNSTTYYVCTGGSISTTLCSVSLMNSGGMYVASVTTNNLPPGMDGITATYSGDSNFTGGNANNLAVTVSKADTATTISKSIDPSTYGDTVILTVKVQDNTTNSTGVPTGTVTLSFKLDATDPNIYYVCSDGSVSTVPCGLGQSLTLAPDNTDPQGKTAKVAVNTSKLPAGLTADAFAYAINAFYAGDTNFKPSGPVGLTQTVNQRPITVTAASDTKTYNGATTSAGVPTITTGTLANGDTGNFTQTFDNRNAGTGKTLTPAGSVNDGQSGNNYAVTSVHVTTGVINPLGIAVTAVASTKTYDGNNSSTGTPTIAPSLISPDTSGFTQAFDNKNAGSGKTLTPSGSVSDGNGGNNYAVTFHNVATGVIDKASLTITAATNTKIYDSTTSAAAAPTTSGLQGTDTVTGLSETYDTKNVGTGKTLSVSAGYTVNDGNSGNNYTVTPVDDHTGVINAAALTITAVTNTKIYDSTTSAAATPTVSGLKGSDTVTNLTETYDTRHAGTSKTLSVATYTVNDGNSGNNYTVTPVADHTGVINPATLTITAVTNTKTYDATTTAAATPTVSGLLGTDTATGLTEIYDNKNAGPAKTLSVATYTVNDGNSGSDYTVNKVDDHTGVINKAPPTLVRRRLQLSRACKAATPSPASRKPTTTRPRARAKHCPSRPTPSTMATVVATTQSPR
jgi:hypothetical protein